MLVDRGHTLITVAHNLRYLVTTIDRTFREIFSRHMTNHATDGIFREYPS